MNAATGDLWEAATDLRLPGAGVPLEFTRTYDAQSAQAEVSAGTQPPPLGYGWAYNLGMTVSYNVATATAQVADENGALDTFVANPAGSPPYQWCPSATTANFCPTSPRVESNLNQNADGTWTYVRLVEGQSTFSFSSSGALTAITNQNGDSLTMSPYSPGSGQPACPSGDSCAEWASSASARALVLATSSASGQLQSVFDPVSGLTSSYAYAGAGCSSWSGNQTPDLCSVSVPGGVSYSFTYDSSNSNPTLAYDMISDTPPGASATTTNVYDTSGRAIQQTDPSGAVATLSYTGDNSSYTGGTTTITEYPLGTGTGEPQNVTVDTFSSNVLVEKTTAVGTPEQSSQFFTRDPVSLQSQQVQDGRGNDSTATFQTYNAGGGTPTSSGNVLSSTDAAGNTTQHAYNGFNQDWCTVDPADYANGARCPSTAPTAPPAPGAPDPNPGVQLSFYNSAGQLTATTDALGNTTSYSYTSGVPGVPSGLMYCSVDPVDYQGNVSCPAYGAAHVAGTATSTFDSAGDRLSSTDADDNTTSYVYNAPGHPGLVSSKTGPDGATTGFSYNGAGEVTSQTVSFGSYSATTLSAYDSYGRQYCQVAPAESAKGVTCPSTPPASPPTPSNDPYLGATITTYDSDGRIVQATNPLGGITYTAYDQAGNAFCTVAPLEASNGVACPTSPPSTPPTVGNDPYLGATITSYDADRRVVQVTNPLGGITTTSYDASGNPAQTVVESNNASADPNVVTSRSYDSDNRVISTTLNPGGTPTATTTEAYDPNGNVFCVAAANSVASGNYQCPAWQTAWITSPPSPASLYSSSPSPSQANDVTTTFFNADDQQIQTTDPDVTTSVTAVDGDGRTYCTADQTNVAAWLSANPAGQYPYLCPVHPPTTPPAQGSSPGYVTKIYDPAGRTTSSTDQVGDTTTYTYNPTGGVATTTDPRGEITSNCYYYQNTPGECAANAPVGGGNASSLFSTTTPATSTDPQGQTTTYTYYPGGQTNQTSTPAGTTTDTYDANGDTLTISYANTATGYSTPSNQSYTYNPDGSRSSMLDATGTTTYTYDANSDVVAEALTAAAGTGLSNRTVSHSYYSTGVLATIAYPSYTGHTNPQVTYTYDPTGAMISSTDWLGDQVVFAHDADGNLTAQNNNVTTPNPAGTSSTAWTYDNADLNTSATTSTTCGATTETLTQSFSASGGSRNPDGQLTQYQAAYSGNCPEPSTYQRNYTYDPAGRVTYQGATAKGNNADSFAYDPSGDPTTMSSHDTTGGFDTYTNSYDNAGEVTAQNPNAGSGGVATSFTYDSVGDQTSTTSPLGVTNYTFDQTGHMTASSLPSGSTAAYSYNGDGLEGSTTTNTALQWTPASQIDSTRSVKAMSCLSTSFCTGLDTSGYATQWNGTSWTSPASVDSHAVESVSCTTASSCKAVDNAGNVLNYSGNNTWASGGSINSTRATYGISCPTSSFCAAVGASGYVVTYNGSWTTPVAKDGNATLESVSCASSSFCEAVDNGGKALPYTSSGWGSAATIDSTRVVNSVSCPSTTMCVAVDASGYAVVYNGSSWGTPSDIDGSHALESVNCASITFCDAVDNAGNVLTFNGTNWTTASNIDAARVINTINCPTTSYCQAGDASGNGLTYTPPRIVTQLTWDSGSSMSLTLSDSANDYIYGPSGTPVEQMALPTSTPTYLTYTPSDSTWVSSNQAGDQTAYWGYDAYGTPAYGTPTSPFGYSGQYEDSTTGLVNDRARWYEPQSGGFTTRDPAFAQTDTAYTYAGDDPVNRSDRSGRDAWDPYSGGRDYGFDSIDFVLQNPQVLEGMNPDQLIQALGGVPEGFQVGPANSSSAGLGAGWKLSSTSGGQVDIRWSPGSARVDHPSDPYWRLSSGKYGKYPDRIEGGQWPEGPEPYVTPPEDPGGDPCLASYVGVGCGGVNGGFGNGGRVGPGEDDPEPIPIEAAYVYAYPCDGGLRL